MRKYLLVSLLFALAACSSSSRLKKYYTPEDKTVFELVERLQKNAGDEEAATLLPEAYKTAADKRRELNEANYANLPPGDRYMQMIKEYEVMKLMYEKISAAPAAKAVVPTLWDPSVAILKAKNGAAKEYYNQGLEYMTYDNRQAARNAYDYFVKANIAMPGYEKVNMMIDEAREKASIKVIVRNANYYNYSFNYWGFQSDWLQQQIVSDLNRQSFRDVRFYTDQDANFNHIRADRIVELNFTELYIGQLFNNRSTFKRSKEVQNGTTRSNPPQPVYKTIYATVTANTRYMQSRATLECRIYDQATGSNILYDRFPDNYEWKVVTASYTGDKEALLPADWTMINNRYVNPPTRYEIADRLVRNCYNLLLSRIKNGVQFGS